jgi:hypothetical protein
MVLAGEQRLFLGPWQESPGASKRVVMLRCDDHRSLVRVGVRSLPKLAVSALSRSMVSDTPESTSMAEVA